MKKTFQHPQLLGDTKRNAKLFFSKYFQALFYRNLGDSITTNQYEYRISTHLYLQRFTHDDIVAVMKSWYRRHHIANVRGHFAHLRHEVIPEAYRYTREIVKANRRKEYLAAKGRRISILALHEVEPALSISELAGRLDLKIAQVLSALKGKL